MFVARLTHDHLDKRKGNVFFSYKGFIRFWTGNLTPGEIYYSSSVPTEQELEKLPQISFKLYDNDDVLYYSGWLKNDSDCMVQQFVLAWAMADSGCTTIKIFNEGTGEWVQEIG